MNSTQQKCVLFSYCPCSGLHGSASDALQANCCTENAAGVEVIAFAFFFVVPWITIGVGLTVDHVARGVHSGNQAHAHSHPQRQLAAQHSTHRTDHHLDHLDPNLPL